jgi:hypothetical protein
VQGTGSPNLYIIKVNGESTNLCRLLLIVPNSIVPFLSQYKVVL